MKRAWLNLRHAVPARIEAFTEGLKRIGYAVQIGTTTRPGEKDILASWNRIQDGRIAADAFESRGLLVLITENSTWGNNFMGKRWYTICKGYHNLAGTYPIGDNERFDSLGVEFGEWKKGHNLILPQRGIGPAKTAMPRKWPIEAISKHGGRLRLHPGTNDSKPIESDLEGVGTVITWGSGAAVKALLRGHPVISEMPNWIAEQNNTEQGRLDMFRRLAWAQWTLDEIRTGEPFLRFGA